LQNVNKMVFWRPCKILHYYHYINCNGTEEAKHDSASWHKSFILDTGTGHRKGKLLRNENNYMPMSNGPLVCYKAYSVYIFSADYIHVHVTGIFSCYHLLLCTILNFIRRLAESNIGFVAVISIVFNNV
jgi:hypothetical protein